LLLPEGGDIFFALEGLHSVLYIPAENDKPVTMYHESLRDFLLASKHSNKYAVDLPACNGIIAHYCLKLMVSKLQGDSCAIFSTTYCGMLAIIGPSTYAARYSALD
jgi:hypothetical protein